MCKLENNPIDGADPQIIDLLDALAIVHVVANVQPNFIDKHTEDGVLNESEFNWALRESLTNTLSSPVQKYCPVLPEGTNKYGMAVVLLNAQELATLTILKAHIKDLRDKQKASKEFFDELASKTAADDETYSDG